MWMWILISGVVLVGLCVLLLIVGLVVDWFGVCL